MANDLSGTVGLDVTDFKTSVAEMNREIRVLESGFRATASSLGDWGKSASGLELRIQTLNDEIGIQQKKVQALWGEYQKVAAEKGATSKAAQDLEIRLNKETETLGKMGVELNSTKSALDQMGKEAEGTAGDVDKLDKEEQANIGTMGRFGAALNGLKEHLSNVGHGFVDLGNKVLSIGKNIALGLGAAAIGAAVGLGALVKKTAEAADEMVEMSDKTGISVETLQILSYQAEQTGTSLETVTGAMARNVRSMASAEKGTGAARDAYRALGISVTDLDGNLRDSQAVFAEALAALGGIENETQRDAIAMALFGKSAQELNPLIALGADGLAEMAKEAQNMGAIMSEDAVRAAADLNDNLASLKAGFKGIVAQLAGAFIPIINKVITAFKSWLSDPAVQAGLKKLVAGIGKVAASISDFVGKLLSGDAKGALLAIFPPNVVNAITTIATALGGFITNTLIPFITKHAPEIKGALAGIAAVLAGAGIVAAIAGIGTAIAAIVSPIGLIVGAVALLGAAWNGNWLGIRDTVSRVWDNNIKPALEQLWAWLSVNIPKAIQVLSDYWKAVLLPALQAVGDFLQAYIFPVLQALWSWLKVNIPAAIQTLADFWNGVLLPALQAQWAFLQTYIFPVLKTLWDWIATNLPIAIKGLADFWNNILLPAIQAIWGFIQNYLIPLFKALFDLIVTVGLIVLNKLYDVWQHYILPALQAVWNFIGKYIIPIFNRLFDNVSGNVLPILHDLADFVANVLTSAFNAVKNAIESAISAVQRLIAQLKKLAGTPATPPVLTPHSPTPFETGLRGISAAMQEIIDMQMPNFALGLSNIDTSQIRGLTLQPGGLQPAGAASTSNQVNIYGGLHLYDVQNADDLLTQLTRLSV